jgi:HAE1 family hydrophobic/amphiphilic exporter-1
VSRRILGTGVMGGMLAATFLAIFIIPVSFYVIERLRGGARDAPAEPAPTAEPEAPAARAGVS